MNDALGGYKRRTISVERHAAMGLAIELTKRGLRPTIVTWETDIEISATRHLYRELQNRQPPSGAAPQAYTIISSRTRLIDASLAVLLYSANASAALLASRDLDIAEFIRSFDLYKAWKSYKVFTTPSEPLSITEMWRLVTDWLHGEAKLIECRFCRVNYLTVRSQQQAAGCPFCL